MQIMILIYFIKFQQDSIQTVHVTDDMYKKKYSLIFTIKDNKVNIFFVKCNYSILHNETFDNNWAIR